MLRRSRPDATREPTAERSARRSRRAALNVGGTVAIAIGVGLYAVPIVLHGRVDRRGLPHGIIWGTDGEIYRDEARFPFWSRHVLSGRGPWLYLAFVKTLLRDIRLVVAVQAALWIAACAWCAATLASLVRRPAARIAAWVLLTGLAVATPLLQWTGAIATESLSLAVTVAAFAAAARLTFAPTRRHALVVAALLALAASARDTNALVVLVVGVGAAVLACVRPAVRRTAAVVAAVAVVAGVANVALASVSERWYMPLIETTALRLQADPTAGPYLRQRGFPSDARVAALDNGYRFLDQTRAIAGGPEYAPLRRWVHDDGRRVYGRFLLTHPVWAVRTAFDNRGDLVVPDVAGYPQSGRVSVPAAAQAAERGVFVRSAVALGIVAAVATAWLCALAVRDERSSRDRARRWLTLAAVTAGLWFVHALAAFHGDALEVPRHEITAALTLRLAIVAVILGALDVGWRRARSIVEPEVRAGGDGAGGGPSVETRMPAAVAD